MYRLPVQRLAAPLPGECHVVCVLQHQMGFAARQSPCRQWFPWLV